MNYIQFKEYLCQNIKVGKLYFNNPDNLSDNCIITWCNYPPNHIDNPLDQANNRFIFSIKGFNKDYQYKPTKISVEMIVSGIHKRMRKKTSSPEKVIESIIEYVNNISLTVKPNLQKDK